MAPIYLNRLGRALHYAIARTLIVILLTLLNPFDVVQQAEERSRDVWQDMYAEGYLEEAYKPGESRTDDPTGRRDITVVLLSEQGLEALSPTHDLDPFDIYDLVEQIQVAPLASPGADEPASIFLDMALGGFAPAGIDGEEMAALSPAEQAKCDGGPTTEPASPFRCMVYLLGKITRYDEWGDDHACQSNPIAKLACIRRARGLPLIFADVRQDGRPPDPREDAGYTALGRIGLLSPAVFNELTEYQLVSPQRAQARENIDYQVFPAALLYAQFCLDAAGSGRACNLNPVVEPTSDPDAATWRRNYWGWRTEYSRPLEIIWGIGAVTRFFEERDSLSQGVTGENCEPAGGVESSVFALFRRSVYGIDLAPGDRCFYARTLTYEQIADASPELLDMAFSGKMVLVGLSTTAANDFVDAPHFGRIPGVFWHAMALDNLLVEGRDYQKVKRPLLGASYSTNDRRDHLVLALTLLAIAAASLWANRRNRLVRFGRSSAGREILLRIFVVGLVIGWTMLLVQIFTGQSSAIPRQYNYAVLTLVVAVEIFLLIRVVTKPAWTILLRRIGWLQVIARSPLEERRRSTRTSGD